MNILSHIQQLILSIEDTPPSPAPDLAIISLPWLLMGIAIFGFGFSREREGGSARVKFFSALPLVIGLWIGWQRFQYVINPMAREIYPLGGRSLQMHYIAFFGPLLALIALVAFTLVQRYVGPREDY